MLIINGRVKAAFLATNDQYEVAEGSHNYVMDNFTKQREYTGIFPEADTLGGDKLYAISFRANKDDVVETFNLGRTIINYSGHGATTYWDAPRFSQRDVLNIKDNGAYPFVISNACITGKFTVAESFGETWLKAKNGAIMFFGSMENTYWDEDDILERRMFDGIFMQQKESFQAITEYGMKELWRHYGGAGRSRYYWETYVTFGDASLKLRRK
ncbi:MAG: C25 family cysteine peptidase [Bacteriovoracaceae bacterium]